ncbi:MAG: hypothetical protein M1820_010839, partial [Bogoriella megaspora]
GNSPHLTSKAALSDTDSSSPESVSDSTLSNLASDATDSGGLGAQIMQGLGASTSSATAVPASTGFRANMALSNTSFAAGDLSSAVVCGSSYLAYTSSTKSWYKNQGNTTKYQTKTITASITQGTGDVYTTIDGIPRVSGNFTPTVTSTYTTIYTSISVARGNEPPPTNGSALASPTCSVGVDECRALYTSYFNSLGIPTDATTVPSITPAPTNSPPCGDFVLRPNSNCVISKVPPGSCTLSGQNVEVFFFPPGTAPSNGTVVQSYAPGVTFTSPSVYLSFDALWAYSTLVGADKFCSSYTDGIHVSGYGLGAAVGLSRAGPTRSNILLSLDPRDLSSVVIDVPGVQTADVISAFASGGSDYVSVASQLYSRFGSNQFAYQQVDLANLIHPPNSAYFLQANGPPGCEWANQTASFRPYDEPQCGTVFEDMYKPQVSLPSQLLSLDPAWSTCFPLVRGVYDPPRFLTKASTVAVPGGATPTSDPPTNAPPAPGNPGNAPTPKPTQPGSVDPGSPSQPEGNGGNPPSENPQQAPPPPPPSPQSDPQATSGGSGQGSAQSNSPQGPNPASQALNPGQSPDLSRLVGALGAGATQAAGSDPGALSSGGQGAGSQGSGGSGSEVSNSGSQGSGGTSPGGQGAESQGSGGSGPGVSNSGSQGSGGTSPGVQGPGNQDPSPANQGSSGSDSGNSDSGSSDSGTQGSGNQDPEGSNPESQGSSVAGSGDPDAGSSNAGSGEGSSNPNAPDNQAPSAVQTATIEIGGTPLTAVEENGALVISGTTLRQGGAPATINGQAISLGSSGIVVGTSTIPVGAAGLSPITAGANIASASAVVTVGSGIYSLTEAANGQYAVINGSITLSVDQPGTVVDGQTLSAVSGGVVVGSSTVSLDASSTASGSNVAGSSASPSQAGTTGIGVEPSSNAERLSRQSSLMFATVYIIAAFIAFL